MKKLHKSKKIFSEQNIMFHKIGKINTEQLPINIFWQGPPGGGGKFLFPYPHKKVYQKLGVLEALIKCFYFRKIRNIY